MVCWHGKAGTAGGGQRHLLTVNCQLLAVIPPGLLLRTPIVFLLRTALKDSPQGPPTPNSQPPTATNRQLPTANRQPPTIVGGRHSRDDATKDPPNTRGSSCPAGKWSFVTNWPRTISHSKVRGPLTPELSGNPLQSVGPGPLRPCLMKRTGLENMFVVCHGYAPVRGGGVEGLDAHPCIQGTHTHQLPGIVYEELSWRGGVYVGPVGGRVFKLMFPESSFESRFVLGVRMCGGSGSLLINEACPLPAVGLRPMSGPVHSPAHRPALSTPPWPRGLRSCTS